MTGIGLFFYDEIVTYFPSSLVIAESIGNDTSKIGKEITSTVKENVDQTKEITYQKIQEGKEASENFVNEKITKNESVESIQEFFSPLA